jgi:hypothetical protein
VSMLEVQTEKTCIARTFSRQDRACQSRFWIILCSLSGQLDDAGEQETTVHSAA